MESRLIIHTVPFSELNIWDVKTFFHQTDIFNKKYPVVLFGEFLKKASIDKIKIEDDKEYKILGARAYGKGAFENRIVKGYTLKMRTYQKAKKDHLFWCKVDTKNGAFGIITEELADGVGSSNMTFARIDTSKANPEYVQLLFRSRKINEYMDGYVSGTTNRKYIKPDQLREEIKIVLPPLSEQSRLVTNYKQKISLADEQEERASKLELETDEYLFEKLGIKEYKKQIKSKGINIIDFKHLEIWGADRLLRGGLNNVLESSIYPNKKLGLLTFINPRTDLSNLDLSDEMSFIPMKNVSDDNGIIETLDLGSKSKSKGYTKFQEGDLIWARITPCMQNGKSAIVNGLKNSLGYGSTEFHVIRQQNDNYRIDFVYHLLRSKAVRQDAVNHFTGSAGQQRVPKEYLENLIVPVVPPEIQKEISNKLERVKAEIRELKTKAEKNRSFAIEEFENEIFKS